MDAEPRKSEGIGTPAYENWRRANEGAPSRTAIEFLLFTDAYIVGELTEGLGPYQLINTVPGPFVTGAVPAVVLKLEYHLEDKWIEANGTYKTDTERYHGGLMPEEIAALVSLCLGVRLKAGGGNRRVDPGGDPRGRPHAYEATHNPYLLKTAHPLPILPRVLGERNLADAILLATLPNLMPHNEIALIRAARLYQDAIWIAESEPELSWIMLVSAIEVAANRWRTAKETPLERLRASKLNNLEALLKKAGGHELLMSVTKQIAPYLGATAKFRDFVLEFLPEPPANRPSEFAQVPWDRKWMKKAMETIYGSRSSALHGGIPFPAPMCAPPEQNADKLAERPIGLATRMQSATWAADDTPMLLQTFEYIIRHCLVRWWTSLLKTETNDAQQIFGVIDGNE